MEHPWQGASNQRGAWEEGKVQHRVEGDRVNKVAALHSRVERNKAAVPIMPPSEPTLAEVECDGDLILAEVGIVENEALGEVVPAGTSSSKGSRSQVATGRGVAVKQMQA